MNQINQWFRHYPYPTPRTYKHMGWGGVEFKVFLFTSRINKK